MGDDSILKKGDKCPECSSEIGTNGRREPKVCDTCLFWAVANRRRPSMFQVEG